MLPSFNEKFLQNFKLTGETEEVVTIVDNIDKGAVFKGTNLWILVFAIFIACLGLNVNSPAVIIGAMLVSPLMGPIMGMGLSLGINDLDLLRKSLSNYAFATLVGLATSSLYFIISPLNAEHSELLARTSPNIYDVLIALFGGLAGIIAITSKQKGNVIPGVAIATALMPPLCTAGYGLANFKINYFLGAFYLFFINSVFIALATLITVRLLKFPLKHLKNEKADIKSRRIIGGIVIMTILPSIYFGYKLIQQDRFLKTARTFIENESVIEGDYLLSTNIDPHTHVITLVYGGRDISKETIEELRSRMKPYGLQTAKLEVKQGFSVLDDQNRGLSQYDQLTTELKIQNEKNTGLQLKLDSLEKEREFSRGMYKELKVLYPGITEAVIQPARILTDSASKGIYLVAITSKERINQKDRQKMNEWLVARLNTKDIQLVIREQGR